MERDLFPYICFGVTHRFGIEFNFAVTHKSDKMQYRDRQPNSEQNLY